MLMRRFPALLLLIAFGLLSLPLEAWNATGHRIIAAIAYDHLTPEAKARVGELLKLHPDLGNLPAREAFLEASVWPDVIRSDSRFYDDTRADPRPTPLLPGFPSMARHTNWHYVNLPFSPDGTPLEPAEIPNALKELRRILRGPGLTAYDLPWLAHLTGDVHQPLHSSDRFTKSLPMGDRGGNLVFVTPGRTLHAFWDDLAGSDSSDAYVDRRAAEIESEFLRRRPRLSADPRKWVDESLELAKRDVYTFGIQSGTREAPIRLSQAYESKAREIARVQFAKAGLRLAAALNAKFSRRRGIEGGSPRK